MKYTIPTLMALSQVTDIVCNWTSNARDCNLLRPNLSERPALKQSSPNISSVSSAVARQPSKDGRSKAKSHCRQRTTTPTRSNLSFTATDVGFARFLQEHSSPTHQRVTAGGRIVPMGHPARPWQMNAEMSDDQMDLSGSAITDIMNGHNMNGHNMNGNNMNGHSMDGHSMNGHSMNGHSMNGHSMNGHSMNGHSMNGHSMNGHSMNGHSMNGHSMNGHSMNGHSMNGHSMNGPAMNGHALNGHAMNLHGMTNPAAAASSSARVSGSAPAGSAPDSDGSDSSSDWSDMDSDGSASHGDGSAPAATLPAVSSLNPEAPVFIPQGGAIPTIIAARMNPEPYWDMGVDIPWTNDTAAAVNSGTEGWDQIWPPLSRDERANNNLVLFKLSVVAQLIVSPVRVSNLPEGGLLQGNPVLTFRPRQPIPLVFLGAEYLAPEIVAPFGLYWYLLTEVFRVTNEGQFQHPDYYRLNLDHLLWLVHNPRDPYEAFTLFHFTEWVEYHRRLFDELLASVDRRRATMMNPDPLLTAERVYYVEQRAYVDEIIRRLEEWLLFAHHSHGSQFRGALISRGLNAPVVADLLPLPVQYDQIGESAQGDDRQEGPGDVWPGNNEAPGDEEDPESVTCGGMGHADGHAVSGPVTNSGRSQSRLTESQFARGPAADGLDGGAHAARRWQEVCSGGGESSSQSAGVEVGPNKGSQVVLPQPLRELSAEGGAHVVREEPAGSKAVFDCFSKLVVSPIKTTAAVSRTHAHAHAQAHANKCGPSEAETMLARLRG